MKLKGTDKVLKNINKEIAGIKGRSTAGLLKGALVVEREANKRVPVEYGTLRASSYVRKSQNNPSAIVIGYSASYAINVHENKEMALQGKPRQSGLGVYWGPKGESGFLINAVFVKSDEVLAQVRESAKVK